LIAEILLATIGASLVIGALGANQAWFDQHFLPVFFLSRRLYVLGETLARIVVAILGLALALVWRPIIARAVAQTAPLALAEAGVRVAIALLLGVGVSELGLRAAFPRATEEPSPQAEPLRHRDARLGWVFVPSRVGHDKVAGRVIDYAFDSHSYRVPSVLQPVDPTRPTILFTGESIITGFGLRWDETIPALVGAALKTQSANIAVFAFADDQAYMRLAAELPRFAHPTAVVILFAPGLVFRDFDDDRPHLEPGLVWRPAVKHWRLNALIRVFIPYHSREDIDRLVDQARAELQAGVRLAQARGATALIVVPHFGQEDATERTLRNRILDQPGLPYVWIDLDPAWRIPHDPHPDSHGAQVIAAAITARLRKPVGPAASPRSD
jgi:hypothetical protein